MPEIISIKTGGDLQFSPEDEAFAYGEGLFETIKLKAGSLCFWSAHWARLAASAKALGLGPLPKEAAVLKALGEGIIEGEDDSGIVKLSLVKRASGTALYLYRREARHRISDLARVRVETSARMNPSSLLAGHKSHNYMEVMMLWRAAQAAGYYDCLRLDTEGYLAEACVSNLFFLKEGRLHTPALETGILPGVIRAEVLRLAAAASIPLDQGHYKPEELADAEAVFLTHSLAGIVPLAAVDGFYEASGASVPEVTLLMERLASAEKSASVKP